MVKWDLYDENFNKTDRIIDEDCLIDNGYYHISTNTWIINSRKEVLLVRNALNYELYYPGFWGPISENVLSGDDGIITVYKSVLDMIGIKIQIDNVKRRDITKRDPFHYMYETYIVKKEIDVDKLKINRDKIINVKWANYDEVNNMLNNGEIALVFKSRIEKYVLPLLR